MQTTLLGFAFAIILALLAALIGPFLVDWTQFRSVFEAEASRMVGMPVRVKGAIDARLLPSPSLTLHGLEIGNPNGDQTLQARLLNIEFALGSLMRGELRAVEAQVAGPEVTVAIDAAGSLDLPKLSAGFVPDSLSIERLNIEDGRAHLVNAATGRRTTFDKVWFNGDLRSLAGPFKGEGAFVASGELYGYRVAAGRLGEDGTLRVRLSLDPSDRLLAAEAEGSLIVGRAKPRFEGTIALSRPASLVVATGESKVKPPWRLTSRVNVGAAGAKLERIDFLYGSEDSGVRLTGTADLRFGRQPRFKGVLSARLLDLDRLIATPETPTRLPADAVKTLIAAYADTLLPPIPAEFSVSADSVTLGGAAVQMFGADVRVGAGAWILDRVEFRAPGLTQVNLSGRLDLAPSMGFSGPVKIETNEPGAFAAWLNGRNDPATQIRPFKARGEVLLNHRQIAIERLKADIDRKAVEGRLRYAFASADNPSRLEAEISAPELDVDALHSFAEAARAGSSLQPPSEIVLSIAVDRAKIAGVEARTVQARLKRDAKLLLVERLSVADLGGASLEATGRVDTSGAAPRGNLALDVEARDLDGIIALAAKFAPAAEEPLRRAAARVPQAKLRVTLGLDGPTRPEPGAKTSVRFAVEGRVGGLRASLHGQAQQDSTKTAADGMAALIGSDVRLEAQMDGDDGSALAALLGFDKAVAVDRKPGFANVVATGKPGDAMRVSGRILVGGLDGKADGTVRIGDALGPSADLTLDIAHADIRPLSGVPDRIAPLPLTLHSRVSLSDHAAKFINLKGKLAGTELRGNLALDFAAGAMVAGQIEADTLDAAAVIAAVIGVPPAVKAARAIPAGWSSEPYGPGQFAGFEGRVDLKVMRAKLTPSLPARQLRTALIFRGSEITLDDFEAHVAGGRLAGRLSFLRSKDGLAVRTHVELTGIDAAAVLPSDPRPGIGGRLSAKLDLEGRGLSPKALIGSLAGTGTVRLEDGYFSSLDPVVFDTIVRASDQGLAVGTSKIRDIVSAALNSGRLRIPRMETTATINAGQVRPANTVAEGDGADLAASGNLDLIQNQIDVRLTLTGSRRNDGSSGRPDIFIGLKGPVATPHRTIDVSALSGWLTVRRIDQQAKKLEALETAVREQEAAQRLGTAASATTPTAGSMAPVSPPVPPTLAEPPVAAVPVAPTTVPQVRKPAVEARKPAPRGATIARPPAASLAPPTASGPTPAPVQPFLTPTNPLPAPAAVPAPVLPSLAPPPVVPAQPASARDPDVPRTAVPDQGSWISSISIPSPLAASRPLAVPAPKVEPAPPLPAPLEIRSIPRGPDRTRGSAIQSRPHEPLPRPSSTQPSVFDNLTGGQ
ncbi:MAG: AsmA family protein [Rhizobiales bacterium]|nr:AsmA family protein [Hyphomicrobiales bacterium]